MPSPTFLRLKRRRDKVRKNSIRPFKKVLWGLPADLLGTLGEEWEKQLRLLFERLGVEGTTTEVGRFVNAPVVRPRLASCLKGTGLETDVRDPAD